MSVLRIVSPLVIGVGVAAAVNGSAVDTPPLAEDAPAERDSKERCDTRSLTTSWNVSPDRPGLVESVSIGNVANACDGGTLYVFTNRVQADPPPVSIPVDASTRVDVALGLPIEAVNQLTIVILAPNAF